VIAKLGMCSDASKDARCVWSHEDYTMHQV
jgi:hypothetical protein